MKFPTSNFQSPMARNAGKLAAARPFQIGHWQSAMGKAAAFTMIEIAICLAIIGFALVAIIGVLPLGMNTQRDVREETVINQDATVLLDLIRSGARNADYLTNYVYAVTNYWGYYDVNGVLVKTNVNGYAYSGIPLVTSLVFPNAPYSSAPITNGANIIGLMSQPEFIADFQGGGKIYPVVPYPSYAASYYKSGCYSNHIVAYVRAVSGLASDRPPQDNPLLIGDSFAYRLFCVNAPMTVDTNNPLTAFATQMAANQRELRLTFLWPQLPNGNYGNGRQTFRATIAGQMNGIQYNNYQNQWLYFYQPQFTNSP